MANSNDNIQVQFAPTPGGSELIIRHGEAPKVVEPIALYIFGSIEAPAAFVQKRGAIINPHTTHVLVSRDEGSIWLKLDETSELSGTVVGKIEADDDFTAMRINKGDWESPRALGEHLRKNRMFFDDAAMFTDLVDKLLNFKAQVAKQLESSDDKRGNKKELVEQQVSTQIPARFYLNMPIHKNMPVVRFEVELYFDLRDAGCKVTLQSIEAEEIRRRQIIGAIDDQLPAFDNYVVVFQ